MGILNNNTVWAKQGDTTPLNQVKLVNLRDYGLNISPQCSYPIARKDVADTLKNIQVNINKEFPGKGYGFQITSSFRPSINPDAKGHAKAVGEDIIPTGGMSWTDLVYVVKKYGSGFDGNIHKNINPYNQPKTEAEYGKIKPEELDNKSKLEQKNYHLDLKYEDKYNPNKKFDDIKLKGDLTGKGADIINENETSTDSGQRFLNDNTNSETVKLYGYLQDNVRQDELAWATPALGAELKRPPDYSPINLQVDKPSFLESLGIPDMQKQYGHLGNFGGYGLRLDNDSRLNSFQTDFAPMSDDIGTSNSVLFNNSLGGVNSSPSFSLNATQEANATKTSNQGIGIENLLAGIVLFSAAAVSIVVSCITPFGGLGIFFNFIFSLW